MTEQIDYEGIVEAFRVHLCEALNLQFSQKEIYIFEEHTFKLCSLVINELEKRLQCDTTIIRESRTTEPAQENTISDTKKAGLEREPLLP